MMTSDNGESAPEAGTFALLVPIIRELHATTLLEIGDALVTGSQGGEGMAVGLVEVPHGDRRGVNREMEQRRRELLRWIAQLDPLMPGPHQGLGISTRVSHDLAVGIREAVYESGSNLVLMEWLGPGSRRPKALNQVLDDISTDPPADLVLVRPAPRGGQLRDTGSRVVAPVRGGGPNARLAMFVARSLAALTGGRLTLLHVHDPGMDTAPRQRQREALDELAEGAGERVCIVERASNRPAQAILDEVDDQDVIVFGARAGGEPSPALVRTEIARTVGHMPGTVLMVRSLISPPTFVESRQDASASS
jgi:nucleotide-binding universal stress UspA family protein